MDETQANLLSGCIDTDMAKENSGFGTDQRQEGPPDSNMPDQWSLGQGLQVPEGDQMDVRCPFNGTTLWLYPIVC